MTEELTRYEVVEQEGTPETLIGYAISRNAPIETLEKLMALQERHEANEARKAYMKAMAAFKTDPPDIFKNKRVSFNTKTGGVTEYNHATLDHVAGSIGKALSKHGLSASWKIEQDKKIKVTCTITHEMGHSESTSLESDAETSGTKNQIQAIGSAITYLQRYTLLALVGLAAKDQDDDANSVEPEYITDKQLSSIVDLIADKKVDERPFLAYMKAESVDKILAKDFNKAVNALQKAKGAK